MRKLSKKPIRAQKINAEAIFSQRRKRLLKQLKGEVAIFVSAPTAVRSRDQEFGYHPNPDLFYLTGFSEPEAALVLLGGAAGPRSVLYLRERNALEERWNGERLGTKRGKRRFHLDEVRDINHFQRDLAELLNGSHVLHFSPGVNPKFDQIVWDYFKSPIGPRFHHPYTLKDARILTAEMRFVKDKEEIQALQHAIDITARSFEWLFPRLNEVTSEAHAAAMLESQFSRLGAHALSFPTIIASGKNATVLHHHPQLQPLWKRELVLIDAGATYRGYAGDLTRTVPVSGKFSTPQAELYDIVLSALRAAISKAKPGNTLDDVHEAAAAAISKGLMDLKIVRKRPAKSAAKNSPKNDYRRYFMHRTSHWLGLDTHDISPVTFNNHFVPASMRPLVPGNVFTVEPGLYIDAADEAVRAPYRGIGIRIEENVLITPDGARVLSERLPVSRSELEALMS